MKHTPGPWTVEGKPGLIAPMIYGNGRPVAKALYHYGSEDPEVDANARLIAAAPDGFEAAELALDAIEDSIRNNELSEAEWNNVTLALRDFVTKVKGQE